MRGIRTNWFYILQQGSNSIEAVSISYEVDKTELWLLRRADVSNNWLKQLSDQRLLGGDKVDKVLGTFHIWQSCQGQICSTKGIIVYVHSEIYIYKDDSWDY